MAIPKRGARRITVDGVTYLWVVSKDDAPDQTPMRVAIETANDAKRSVVV